MKTSDEKMFHNSVLYIIVSFAQKGISFFLLPVYTYYLTVEDYGLTSIVTIFSSLVSMIFIMALDSAIIRYYYTLREDPKALSRFCSTLMLSVVLFNVSGGLLILTVGKPLINILLEGVPVYPYVLLGIIYVIANSIYSIFQALLNAMQEGKWFAINNMCYFLLQVLLTVLFIVVLKRGAFGVLSANAVTATLFAMMALYQMLRRGMICIAFSLNDLKTGLAYSIPILPHRLSYLLNIFFARVVINLNMSIQFVGLYNVGAQFGNIIDTAMSSANNAYRPWLFRLLVAKGDARKIIPAMTMLLMKGIMVLCLVVGVFAKETVFIMTQASYHSAWVVIPVMAIAFVFRNVFLFYFSACMYNIKTSRLVSIITLLSELLAIVITLFTVNRFGIIAPAIGMLSSKIISCIFAGVLSEKYEPIGLPKNEVVSNILICIITMLIALFFDLICRTPVISIEIIVYKLIIITIGIIFMMGSDMVIVINYCNKVLKSLFKKGR